MMLAVVQQQEGTGFAFNANSENGLLIAGKTGTAQNGVSANLMPFSPLLPRLTTQR